MSRFHGLMRALLVFAIGTLIGSTGAHAQTGTLRCTSSINPAATTVTVSSTGQLSATSIPMVIRFACRSTASASKNGNLNATLTFVDESNIGVGSYLRRKSGTQTAAYMFVKYAGNPTTTAPTSVPNCSGTAPSHPASNASVALTSNFPVVGPGSFSVRDYYLSACVWIPAQTVSVGGEYTGKLQIATSGTVTSGGGTFESITNSSASVLTATFPTSCTINNLPNVDFKYPSFSSSEVVFSQLLTSVACNSGSWSVDIRDSNSSSVTSPLTGRVKDIDYELGLSSSSSLAAGALKPRFPDSGSQSGPASIYLQGRAAAGQSGDHVCTPPCVTGKTYTLTITFN